MVDLGSKKYNPRKLDRYWLKHVKRALQEEISVECKEQLINQITKIIRDDESKTKSDAKNGTSSPMASNRYTEHVSSVYMPGSG